MTKIKSLLICLILTVFCSTSIVAHSVQIAYCINCNGDLRIFVEHWHGTQDPNSTNMTIQLNINGNTTTQTNPPVAGIINVPFGQLPGCTTPITSVAGCNGQMNTYNDWVYYDYFGLPSGQPLSFTILSGNNSFTSDGCGMYPLTVNFNIPSTTTNGTPVQVCQGQNIPAINVPVNVSWTNSNPGIGLPASGTGPIAPTPATGVGSGVVTYNNACGVNNTTITVVPSLTSSFNNNGNGATGVCLGTPINFTNTSPVSSTYTWNFGNGNTSNVQNPTYTYPTAGVYTVSLTVGNGSSCPGTSTAQVVINPFPNANFTIPNGCMGTNLNVTNTSTVAFGPLNYTFTANGSTPNTSNAANPVLNYAASGVYTINLIAATPAGCSSTITKTVSVFGFAVPNFNASDVCYNSVTNFTNTTSTSVNANTGAVSTWLWNFGGGSPNSNAQTPTNTYNNPPNLTANTVYTVNLTATTVNGCVSNISKTLTVYSLPTASITSSPVCLTNSTTISNVGSNNGNPYSNFQWDFDNNGSIDLSGTSPTANYVYPNSGNPVASYTAITTPLGTTLQCKTSAVTTVTVFPGPQAIITNTNACFGNAIGMSGVTSTLSVGAFTNYAWSYGNGNTSPVNPTPSTSATYPSSGIYTVTLTVSTNNGCSSTATKTISVFGRAVINFGPTAVCYNTPTAFTNSTSTTINANTGAVASYSWNFGVPGGGSTATNPIFTYTNPANATANITYSATLTATTINGCVDALTKTLTVYSLPTSDFSSDQVCRGLPTTLNFIGSGNGNPLNNFSWDFDNNGSTDLTNTSLSTGYVFPNHGNTNVSYTVSTSPEPGLTCRTSTMKSVYVHPIPFANITNTNTCIDTQPSNISGVTSTIAIGTITNYAWNYGNGNTSVTNLTYPTTHSFTSAGNYVVTLTVTSNGGCSHTNSTTISVWEKPYASFVYSKTCFGKRTNFSGTQAAVSGSIVAYNWDFNNTTNTSEALGQNVSYTMTGQGTQTVNMLLTTDRGCTNIIPGTMYVNYIPRPNFYAPKRAGCSDLCIPILDSSAVLTGPAKNDKWEWSFGNGQSFNSNNGNLGNICFTNYSNTALKQYTLKLILRSDSGCVDSITKNNYISVYPNPKADFDWKGVDGNILTPEVEFTNTSIGASSLHWFFNDMNVTDSSNKINPVHYFNTDIPRDYQVWLAVRNQYGCKDTTSKFITIEPDFTFYIPNTFTPNGDGINDNFTGKGIGVKTFKMRIFDRWGELLYYTEDMVKGWDGTVKGVDTPDKVDVYSYRVIVTDLKGKDREFVGHVTLLK